MSDESPAFLEDPSPERFMAEALKEARRACEAEEVPVGAVIIKGDQVILKFLKNSSILKEGTILSVQRHYTVTENDSLKALNSRLDDLYYIKDIIDSMPNSEAYKSFYDKRIDKDSMKEINDLLAHEHSLATVVEGESVLQLWSNLGIKLKVQNSIN